MVLITPSYVGKYSKENGELDSVILLCSIAISRMCMWKVCHSHMDHMGKDGTSGHVQLQL